MLKISRGPWLLLTLSATLLAGCVVDDPYYYDDRRTDAPVYYHDHSRTPHYVPVPYDDGRPRYYHDDRRPRVERYPPPPPPPRDRRDQDRRDRDRDERNDRHSVRTEVRPHDNRRTEELPVRPPPPLRVVPKPKLNDGDNRNYEAPPPPRYRAKPYGDPNRTP